MMMSTYKNGVGTHLRYKVYLPLASPLPPSSLLPCDLIFFLHPFLYSWCGRDQLPSPPLPTHKTLLLPFPIRRLTTSMVFYCSIHLSYHIISYHIMAWHGMTSTTTTTRCVAFQAADVFIDVLSDRGFQCSHRVVKNKYPAHISLQSGRIEYAMESSNHFRIQFQTEALRRNAQVRFVYECIHDIYPLSSSISLHLSFPRVSIR